MTPLEIYRHKRNFKKTPEPSPARRRPQELKKVKSKPLMFVIQEHHASHLHFDLRLEMEGVLRSWAVPKGPTSIPETKRLAMEVEDHPISYGSFEGFIPEGEYGAGEVLLWDTGTYETEGDPVAAYRKGHIDLVMKGNRMKGKWTLIRTHGKGERAQWLLFKRNDRYARHERKFKPIKNYGAWKEHARRPTASAPMARPTVRTSSHAPKFIEPELALLVETPPTGPEWIHETKFDGYRTQTRFEYGDVQLLTRKGLDWTAKYRPIADSLKHLKVDSAILDGEMVVLDEHGNSDFQALQVGLKNQPKNPANSPLVYYVFDLLYLNGHDIRDQPLSDRKALLRQIVKSLRRKNVRFSEDNPLPGPKILKRACSHEEEGVISKRVDSPYLSARNGDWVKTKCRKQQEFVIGGFSEGTGARGQHFGALLLGVYEGGKLRYVGRCGTGFDQKTLRQVDQKLKDLETKASPFQIGSPKDRDVHFIQPKLVAEVSFAMWTKDGLLRVPVFHGLREDKPPREVRQEVASESPKTPLLSHPEKVLYTREGITKRQIADYYRVVAKWMLPQVAHRPLSLKRCPEGTRGGCFFQKHLQHLPENTPLGQVAIAEKSARRHYATVDSTEGLVALVQLGGYEIHAWGCRAPEIEHPDQIVMDFDPDPGVPYARVADAVMELKEILDELKLKSFVKTTGGKGLHVHIPMEPVYSWDQIKDLAKNLADRMVELHPDRYTSTLSKKARKGKIFVDYLRNGRGATAVAPYSLRAREVSSVAMPIEWTEVKRLKDPSKFTLRMALQHLKKRKRDPWAKFPVGGRI